MTHLRDLEAKLCYRATTQYEIARTSQCDIVRMGMGYCRLTEKGSAGQSSRLQAAIFMRSCSQTKLNNNLALHCFDHGLCALPWKAGSCGPPRTTPQNTRQCRHGRCFSLR